MAGEQNNKSHSSDVGNCVPDMSTPIELFALIVIFVTRLYINNDNDFIRCILDAGSKIQITHTVSPQKAHPI